MLKVIMGLKGTGKTKTLIEMVNKSVAAESGNVVCIEKGAKLTYDVSRDARLICMDDFKISDIDVFYGFVCGLLAGNRDITAIYIDSVLKICDAGVDKLEQFLDKLSAFADENNINILVTVSMDAASATEKIRKYL